MKWSLPVPNLLTVNAFDLCTRNIEDKSRNNRIRSYQPNIQNSDEDYSLRASNSLLHQMLISKRPQDNVLIDDMKWLYKNKFCRGDGRRQFYNQVRLAATFCPLCGGEGIVSTLDHHLAQTSFPYLSVTPLNLVPSCFTCNKEKLSIYPTVASEQTLHPYFDRVENFLWLFASVNHSSPPSLTYFVNPPDEMPALLGERMSKHFKMLKLADRFSKRSASLLSSLRTTLIRHFNSGGPRNVRDELYFASHGHDWNTWEHAAYQCLAEDSWYCDGNFLF